MSRKSRKRRRKIITVICICILLAVAGILACFLIKERKDAQQQAKQEAEQEKLQEAALEEQKKEQEKQKKEEEEKKAQEEEEKKQAEEAAEEAALQEAAEQEKSQNGVEGLDDLKAEISEVLAGYEGDWSVYVYDLQTDEYLDINSHPMKAASLIKLYIMGAVYEKIQAGELEQTDEINQLLNQMITVSHNESSNELVRRLSPTGDNHEEGMKVVNAFAAEGGYQDTSQGRDLRDFREVPATGENYTSARDCGMFLREVYRSSCVSEQASAEMLNYLKNQQRRHKIPAGLPQGVMSANKTGELGDTENDAAIVFGENGDYILCVMSQGLSDTASAQQHIQSLSSQVYSYFNGTSDLN